jgi:hypothetical protein
MKTNNKTTLHETGLRFIFSNTKCALGTHEGTLSKFPHADNLPAHRLICFTEDSDHIQLCPNNELPIGVTYQPGTSTLLPVCIHLLGTSKYTLHIQTSDTVKAGSLLCSDDDGYVKSIPTTSGQYTCIGIALTDGQKDDLIEVSTTVPHKIEIKE